MPLQLKIGRTLADTTAFVLAQEIEFVFSNHLFSPERRREMPQIVNRQVERRIAILNELLDLARIESRRGTDFELESTDFRPQPDAPGAEESVEPLGGRMDLISVTGQGTQVTLWLPAAAARATQPAPIPPTPTPPTPTMKALH